MLQGIHHFADYCWYITKKWYRAIVPPNNASLQQEFPAFISKQDLFVSTDGTQASLISPKAYFYIRQRQLEMALNEDNPETLTSQLYTPESHPDLNLKWPVFIGENGRMITILRDDKRKLGEGSFGKVYWGIDVDTGKQVAAKYLFPRNKDEKKEARGEIKAMGQLDRLVSSIEAENAVVVVDEFNPGKIFLDFIHPIRADQSLTTLLSKMEMAVQFLQAIDSQFHQKQYLHRDIQLENVMWNPKTKQAKVIDFGSAIAIRATQGKKLPDMGTNMYQAPEVVAGRYSVATDVYACGVALIEIFSQFDIFTHEEKWLQLREALSKRDNHKTRKAFTECLNEAANDLLGGHPPKELIEIVNLIKHMIHANPKQRPQALSEVIAVIQKNQTQLSAQIQSTQVASSSRMSLVN